jgi:hypothetical protein
MSSGIYAGDVDLLRPFVVVSSPAVAGRLAVSPLFLPHPLHIERRHARSFGLRQNRLD